MENGCNVAIAVPMNFHSQELTACIDGVEVFWATAANEDDVHSNIRRIRARAIFYRLLLRRLKIGVDFMILANPNSELVPAIYWANSKATRTIALYDDVRKLNCPTTITDYVTYCLGCIADRVIPRLVLANAAISTTLRKRLEMTAPQNAAFICPPVVNTAEFMQRDDKRILCRQKFAVGQSTLLGFLGTFWVIEGVKTLLMAARELRASRVDFKLVLCGAAHHGFPCDRVDDLIAEYQLGDFIILNGWLPKTEVIDVMSACDILIAPKLAARENSAGMPSKLAEYMSMGKAIVVSRVGDIPLYAIDNQNCLLCEPGDSASLVAAISRLSSDVGLRNRLGIEARRTAQEQFDYRRVAANLLEQVTKLSA
jgi:glycosyltransferase involved in cell wall biosynthesis